MATLGSGQPITATEDLHAQAVYRALTLGNSTQLPGAQRRIKTKRFCGHRRGALSAKRSKARCKPVEKILLRSPASMIVSSYKIDVQRTQAHIGTGPKSVPNSTQSNAATISIMAPGSESRLDPWYPHRYLT